MTAPRHPSARPSAGRQRVVVDAVEARRLLSAVVGGVVFVDPNGNGKQDAGEAPVANAAIYLDLNYNGKQDATEPATSTDASGAYRFANAPAASFGVTLAKSPLFTPTTPASGQIAMRAADGQTYLNRNFAVKLTTSDPTPVPTPTPTPTPTPVPTGSAAVGGTVYVDANGNGVADGGEKGRSGVGVWLDYDGDNVVDAGEPTATTNASGAYAFSGVKVNASFAVRLRPGTGYARTFPAGDGGIWMRAADGQTYLNRNFGIRLLNAPTLSLAGTIAAAATKVMAHDTLTANKSAYPYVTTGGTWSTTNATGWTSGFYPGTLWLAYGATGDAATLAAAKRWTAGIAGQASDTTNHDVGFQVFDSFGNGYKLTGDAAYLPTLRTAAKSLSTRFSPKTGAIRSWGNDGGTQQVIIDSMMNLELLEWAAKNGGTSAVAGYSLQQIAISHADKVLANHVRADGSTFHVVEYDPTTGAAKDPTKYAGYKQAYSDASTWSRGQAWGIYGFTMMYRETGLTRYRDAAERLADYWIAHLPADGVPPADFAYGTAGVPYTTANKDSTAGAVAASAMLELSTLVATDGERSTYFDAAQRMLTALTSPAYLSLDNSFASLLKHGSHDAAAPDDAGYAWGDYYLMEAMTRYQKVAGATA